MHKKPATKFPFILVSIFSVCSLLLSCEMPSDGHHKGDDPSAPETPSYSALLGTWVDESDSSDSFTISATGIVLTKTAAEKLMSVQLDWLEQWEIEYTNSSYQFSVDEYIQEIRDFCQRWYEEDGEEVLSATYYYDENGEKKNYTWLEKLDIEFQDLDFYKKGNSLFIGGGGYIYLWLDDPGETLHVRYIQYFNSELHGKECSYKRKASSSGGSSSSASDSDITGSYTISGANGSTITFASNGTWTYNYNSRTAEGTWSVSDGELEMTYSLNGYSSTAAFAVSVSDDKYTLKGKSGAYQTIIASVFKITDQTAMQDGVVTLVRK